MSSNSSDDSAHLSPAASLPLDLQCLLQRPNSFIFAMYTAAITLLLPLFAYVLHHGVQQWRRKSSSSSSSSSSSMSHSDVFTYHMAMMELVGVFGSLLCCSGVYRQDVVMLLVGGVMLSFTWCGQLFFHVLTCVERHLAAVHPVAYLGMRSGRGVRMRNAAVACAWLLSLVWMVQVQHQRLVYMVFFLLGSSLAVISFCSVSVLCVLLRPGPGGRGGNGWRVDQSKKRAFNTIVEILGVLLLRFIGNSVWFVLFTIGGAECSVTTVWLNWMNLPSSLVLPSLYLRAVRGRLRSQQQQQRQDKD